jgi:hypothetical protein
MAEDGFAADLQYALDQLNNAPPPSRDKAQFQVALYNKLQRWGAKKTMSNEDRLFKPGNPGGPGRAVGSRNRLTNSFLKALADDFEEHGAATIKITRIEKPDVYFRAIAALMPKEFQVADAKLGELTEEDIAGMLATIREMQAQTKRQLELAESKEPENERKLH